MVCDKNCENCKYEDCICESTDYSDIDTGNFDLSISKQRAIEKGTYAIWKYNHSEKCKANQKRYRQSEKGKAVAKRKREKAIASGKNAEYCRNYYRRKKERMLLESEG